jgi:ribulose 1,5-bisphosphate carboxylase large subunit-like protein
MRQAVDGTLKGQTLEEYSQNQKELRLALEQWRE